MTAQSSKRQTSLNKAQAAATSRYRFARPDGRLDVFPGSPLDNPVRTEGDSGLLSTQTHKALDAAPEVDSQRYEQALSTLSRLASCSPSELPTRRSIFNIVNLLVSGRPGKSKWQHAKNAFSACFSKREAVKKKANNFALGLICGSLVCVLLIALLGIVRLVDPFFVFIPLCGILIGCFACVVSDANLVDGTIHQKIQRKFPLPEVNGFACLDENKRLCSSDVANLNGEDLLRFQATPFARAYLLDALKQEVPLLVKDIEILQMLEKIGCPGSDISEHADSHALELSK